MLQKPMTAHANRRAHNERCKECKNSVLKLFAARYGKVQKNWDLDIPCRLEDYRNTHLSEILGRIYNALRTHRGFDHFVKRGRLPRVDFFIPDKSLIIEFDESQHFTKPREIALSFYPQDRKPGFSVEKWRGLCRELDAGDNDPPYRDEQRAWYDTLRDFAPAFLGAGQTIRLYSHDLIWCSLDPSNKSDLITFEQILIGKIGGNYAGQN